jgi:hypothetical protein
MPYAKKPGARCKAGYKQWGKGSLTCMKNAKYVKGYRSTAAQVARGEVSTYRKDGKPDRRFKVNRPGYKIPKKTGVSVAY